MRTKSFTGIFTLLFLVSVAFAQLTIPASAQTDGQPEAVYTVGEGFDFATRVLSDPWDMEQFTDISQWLNNASTYLLNIQVANGVFSATTAASYSEFYALFPGYILGMNTGKIGAMYPISSSQFACYSMAMYASWSSGTNYFLPEWMADRDLTRWSRPDDLWGAAYPYYLTNGSWKLYQGNLNSPPQLINKPWNYLSTWQALRIVPSTVANTQFSIDWIRLTDCTPVWVTFSGLPAGTYNLWIVHGSPERQILAKEAITPAADGTYAWDAQGVEPGAYTYYIKTSTGSVVQQGSLNVDGTPIASFNRPAQYTGIEYGTSNGNAWDIDPTDVTYIACVNYSFSNGMLYLDTLPPAQLSDGCVGDGAGESDPHIFLNTPDHGNLSAYRYLSFNMSQNGTISYPDKGMIVRLFWQLDRIGLTDCWYTSHAIPLDIGRHTYTIDMYDPRNGTPEARTPSDCPLVTWANQAAIGPLVQFRIDPNENVLSWTFHQEIDWIRLTRVEAVRQGQPAEVRLLLNTPVAELSTLNLYYTTDRSQPTQHPTARFTPQVISGSYLNFLPMALRQPSRHDLFIDALSADVVYLWDTTGVSPGTYYVCAVVGDAHTSAAYCSQAPFQIVSP
jgi:hypothetical protein